MFGILHTPQSVNGGALCEPLPSALRGGGTIPKISKFRGKHLTKLLKFRENQTPYPYVKKCKFLVVKAAEVGFSNPYSPTPLHIHTDPKNRIK